VNWKNKLENRRDVFLGYCSSHRGAAGNVKRYLTHKLKVSVLDWYDDFVSGGSILGKLEEAASRCSAGIFLFTKDDPLMSYDGNAAPRDNLVFEAGFFASAKGKERVLIIREEGLRMPADLEGDMYVSFKNLSNISSIEGYLKQFILRRL